MTTRSCITIVASAVLISSVSLGAAAQNTFSGTITFALRSESGRDGTLIETVSGNKVRLETTDSAHTTPRGAFIIDRGAQTFTVLMNAQQKYIVRTEADVKAMAASMGGGGQGASESAGQVSVVNTGRTETIAGVSCQVYHVTGSNSQTSDVCVAEGMGFLSGLSDLMTSMKGMGGMATTPAMEHLGELLKGGRGVLKVTEYKNGQSTVVLVATKIDRTPPPASAFAPPPGYTELQLPAGMGARRACDIR
jgi:hypothetical protein